MLVPPCLACLQFGRDIFDLGESLYSFFLRYGEEFDYEQYAVSIRSGGIVPKRSLPFANDSARFAASTQSWNDGVSWYQRLSVDCPISGEELWDPWNLPYLPCEIPG